MAAGNQQDRINGLDSIRFVCAFWVLLGHSGIEATLKSSPNATASFLGSVVGMAINGPAAVIVFFLVSGFCIHYPYRSGAPLNISSFYTRRFIRIGVPFLAVIPIYHLILPVPLVETPLWSLICEMAYYALYPALLFTAQKIGWKTLVGASYLLAYLVIATKPNATQFMEYGNSLNWAVGLPAWLLGCVIAQSFNLSGSMAPSPGRLWLLRGAVVGLSIFCTYLRWHLPWVKIGFNWTLDLFAVGAFYWLIEEIRYWQAHAPSMRLEKLGSWSYSLYIVHVLAIFGLLRWLKATIGIPLLGNVAVIFAALLLSYVFFLCVEQPAHHLAKILANRLKLHTQSRASSPIP